MNAPLQHKLLEDAPIDELRRGIWSPTQLLQMIVAGRSILTCRSRRSGDRLTFRFRRPDPKPGQVAPIWVSFLDGHNEKRSWTFLGTMWPNEQRLIPWTLRASPKVTSDPTHPARRGAIWISMHLPQQVDVLMEQAEWWHEGRCARCARRLTVPESIESGFGPECAKRTGG